MNKKTWTQNETNLLIKLRADHNLKDIAVILDRTYASVKAQSLLFTTSKRKSPIKVPKVVQRITVLGNKTVHKLL